MKKSLSAWVAKVCLPMIFLGIGFACSLFGATKIKYGDSIRIKNWETDAYVTVDNANKVWSSRVADSRSVFKILPTIASTKIGDVVKYGDKVWFQAGDNLYLGRFGDWRLIYAMKCQMFGVGPQAQAAQFTISSGSGELSDVCLINLALNPSECLRFNISGGNEIFLAPDNWTIPEKTKKVLIVKAGEAAVESKPFNFSVRPLTTTEIVEQSAEFGK